MARLLLLAGLICTVLVLIGVAVSALTRAAQDSRTLARDLVTSDSGSGKEGTMERVSYVALILLMLGVTSGLLGGL